MGTVWTFKGQDPVVRTPISANPRLNVHPGFFLSKAISWKKFFYSFWSVLSSNCRQRELNWTCYPSLSFALTLGYLNSASNNPAQGARFSNVPGRVQAGLKTCVENDIFWSETVGSRLGKPGGTPQTRITRRTTLYGFLGSLARFCNTRISSIIIYNFSQG